MKTFEDLFGELQHKAATRPGSSGTVEELDHEAHFIGKKLVEEAAEAWMACEHGSDEVACEEISQLLHHAQIVTLVRGYSLQDVYRYLQSPNPLTSPTRLPHHKSGIAVLRIAIPNKSSLSDPAIAMLSEAGYRIRHTDRELVLIDGANDAELFFLRPCDIVIYVGQGTVHADIVGRGLLLDSGIDTIKHLSLGSARSTSRFAAPRRTMSSLADIAGRCVATSYGVLARSYLAARGVGAQTVHLDGAVKSSVQLGVADLIADVVEIGTTLWAAGLETLGNPILVNEAVLITTEQFRVEPGLATLVRRLEEVLCTRVYVSIDYDTPMNKLHLVTSLTPGIESPTVSLPQSPDWVTVRAMVPRADMDRIMDELYDRLLCTPPSPRDWRSFGG